MNEWLVYGLIALAIGEAFYLIAARFVNKEDFKDLWIGIKFVSLLSGGLMAGLGYWINYQGLRATLIDLAPLLIIFGLFCFFKINYWLGMKVNNMGSKKK